MICVKIKHNQQNHLYKTKEKMNADYGFWRNPWKDPMICFQPSYKVGHSDPKTKYYAINSVYDIFSIQLCITFLSKQVNTIIHIVLLCLRVYPFHVKVVVFNFGSRLLFKICQTFMSLECPSVLVEWRGRWCTGSWFQSYDWALSPMKSSTKAQRF